MWNKLDQVNDLGCPNCDAYGEKNKVHNGYYCPKCFYLVGICGECNKRSTGLVMWGMYSPLPTQCNPSRQDKAVMLQGLESLEAHYKYFRAPYYADKVDPSTRWLFNCKECKNLFGVCTSLSLEWNWDESKNVI